MSLERIKKKLKSFDYFNLGSSFILWYMVVFFSFPVVFYLRLLPISKIKWYRQHDVSLISWKAILFLAIGLAAFILGYWFFYRYLKIDKKMSNVPNIFKKKWKKHRIPYVIVLLFLIGLATKIIRIIFGGFFHIGMDPAFVSSPFFGAVGYLDWFGFFALVVSFVHYFNLRLEKEKNWRIWRSISWLLFGIETIYGFLSGSKFLVIVPVLMYALTAHFSYRRSRKRIIAAILLIVLILMPVTNYYKQAVLALGENKTEESQDISQVYQSIGKRFSTQRLKNFFDFVPSEVKSEPKFLAPFHYAMNSSIGRIAQSRVINSIVENKDGFLLGETYKDFFVRLGPPKFLWPEKTYSGLDGNEFGREYGIIFGGDHKTTVGPTMVGDLYLNFGLVGIILGMVFFGLLFHTIFDYFVTFSSRGSSGIMIYSIIWIRIMKSAENWISPAYAGMIKFLIILLIVHFLLTLDFKKLIPVHEK